MNDAKSLPSERLRAGRDLCRSSNGPRRSAMSMDDLLDLAAAVHSARETFCNSIGTTREDACRFNLAQTLWNDKGSFAPALFELAECRISTEALKLAIRHIEHMAAWITKQNAGYSFESLGEDMPGLRAIADASP